MLTEKKCKGTGKASGHGCGELVPQVVDGRPNRMYGLGKSCGCFWAWLRNTEKGHETIQKFSLKAKKDVSKEKKKAHRQFKIQATNWKNKLQTKVQEIARLIDFGHTCIVRKTNGQMHGGHVFSKGAHPEMRFNLHNIHRQSAYSNKYRSDEGYMKDAIAEEYGEDYLEFIKGLREAEQVKYPNSTYHLFYIRACTMANNLKKVKRVRTAKQRISMRNRVNRELRIYDPNDCTFIK